MLLLAPSTTGTDPSELTAADALRASPVTAELAARPGVSAHQLSTATRHAEREVVDQLLALRNLELVVARSGGRWRLTEASDAFLHAVDR